MAVLRKIKDKLQRIAKTASSKKNNSSKVSSPKIFNIGAKKIRGSKAPGTVSSPGNGKAKKDVVLKAKNEIIGIQETVVGKAKFSTPEASRPAPRLLPQDLPIFYGDNKIILQVRDPRWLYTYWEITPETLSGLKNQYGEVIYSAKRILRIYDVTYINFNGVNAHRFFDIEINHQANSWYIDTNGPGRSWCVDFGIMLPDGRFITILRSNIVQTPLDGPSSVTDEEWMIPEEIFARLYGMGFGVRQSSPLGKAWQERIKRELFSGILSSPGMGSSALSVKREAAKERKFWLVVNTELIVYGATEPDAKVTVQGKEIKLREDGTFTLRFALPDGEQIIPVNAISSDGVDERTITPIVNKETR